MIMLQILDNQWKDHLLSMDHLKEGIGLRGYGQKDPLVEYKKESFEIFASVLTQAERCASPLLVIQSTPRCAFASPVQATRQAKQTMSAVANLLIPETPR